MTWTIDGKPIDIGSGQTLCIPQGAVHGLNRPIGNREKTKSL